MSNQPEALLSHLRSFDFSRTNICYTLNKLLKKTDPWKTRTKTIGGHPPLRLFRPRSLPEVPTLFRCQWVMASASVSGFWEGKWRVEMVHPPGITKVAAGRSPFSIGYYWRTTFF